MQLVYGLEVILPIQLELSVVKMLQGLVAKNNKIKRVSNKLVELQDHRDMVYQGFKDLSLEIKGFHSIKIPRTWSSQKETMS